MDRLGKGANLPGWPTDGSEQEVVVVVVGFAGNRPARLRVQPGMTEYTDPELAEMHAEGVSCPDDDHAREYYALLDWLDEQLMAQRDL